MQTLEKEHVWLSEHYYSHANFGKRTCLALRTLFVVQLFLFKRQKYQLYAVTHILFLTTENG